MMMTNLVVNLFVILNSVQLRGGHVGNLQQWKGATSPHKEESHGMAPALSITYVSTQIFRIWNYNHIQDTHQCIMHRMHLNILQEQNVKFIRKTTILFF